VVVSLKILQLLLWHYFNPTCCFKVLFFTYKMCGDWRYEGRFTPCVLYLNMSCLCDYTSHIWHLQFTKYERKRGKESQCRWLLLLDHSSLGSKGRFMPHTWDETRETWQDTAPNATISGQGTGVFQFLLGLTHLHLIYFRQILSKNMRKNSGFAAQIWLKNLETS